MRKIVLMLLVFVGMLPLTKIYSQEKEEEVFTFVEVNPAYPGGDEARMKFLIENLKFPEKAKENNIQGTVYVTFVVEKDGSISNVKVIRGIGGGCDEEVVRVIRKMPKWTPGYQRGKTVRAQFNMPIKFTLSDGNSNIEKPKTKSELRKERRKKE